MKKMIQIKNTYYYHFVVRFVLMILIPILCFWLLYERILNYHYAENRVATMQMNMENSLSLLDSSFHSVSNIFTAVAGNPEITYFLDYQTQRKNMFFGNFNDIREFCNELYLITPYMKHLRIYSDNPDIIYAPPFFRLEEFEPGEAVLKKLENAMLEEMVWHVALPENGETLPTVYVYQKMYSAYYKKCIGYIEICLSSAMLSDYLEVISTFYDSQAVDLTIFLEGNVIYSTGNPKEQEEYDALTADGVKSGYEVMFFQNQYRNYLHIPEWNMQIVCEGKLVDVNVTSPYKLPSIFITIIVLILLALFAEFLRDVLTLSKRIHAFTIFIKQADPDYLQPFQPEQKAVIAIDELDSLVDAYNGLIRENNSMISQMEKIELFTQKARYIALQQQIHPHFIYGTLETIRMMTLQEKNEEAASMIYSLSTLLRYSMNITEEPVTLRDELKMAGHYMEIQCIRFDGRIRYVTEIEEDLMDFQMPSFILQPILENAIIYGVSQTEHPCDLILKAYREEGVVALKISNNGQLISSERLQEVNQLLSREIQSRDFRGNQNGLALYNISERIAIYFGGRASIRLAREDGYTVNIIEVNEGEKDVPHTSG